ncbi:hypothetical protein lerEdw1_006940, partial [Lerista edwardsae]
SELVEDLALLSQTNNSVALHWIHSEGCIDANVTANISGLLAGQSYNMTVWRIWNGSCSKAQSIPVATQPSPVLNVEIKSCTVNSLEIGWNLPVVHHNTCTCVVSLPDTICEHNCSCVEPIQYAKNPYNMSGLKAGVTYTVMVWAVANNVCSIPTCIKATTAPNKPSNVSVNGTPNSTHNISISWVRPEDRNEAEYQYLVIWNNATQTMNQTTDGDNCTLHGLEPGSLYLVNLSSWINGISSANASEWALTEPAGVDRVKCLPSGYSLNVSWTYPQDAGVTAFQVSGFDRPIDTQNTSVVVNNLRPGWRYLIVVSSFWYNQRESSSRRVCPIIKDKGAELAGLVIGALCLALLFLLTLGLLLFYFRRRGENIFWKPKTAKQSLRVVAPVPVSDFPGHCSEHLSDSAFGFAQEYQQLQDVGTGQPWSVAQRPENQVKNRYSNVLPYDNSRVLLTPKPGDPNSDYINASYLPGYKSAKEFIAAQGPLPVTLHDFWHMIWEQRVNTLVMLTKCIENEREKCEHYWPLDYTPCVYGNITVSVVTETILPDWTIRDFRMKKVNSNQTHESEVRFARHYHYTAWPDHQVPLDTSTILRFRDLVREHMEQQEGSGPTLVHCSAGVGRTGTFIALDSLLCQAQNEGEVGVFAFVQRMRLHRPLMIQTESQYIFLHQCLLDRIQSDLQNDSEKLVHTAVYENITAVQGYEVTRV